MGSLWIPDSVGGGGTSTLQGFRRAGSWYSHDVVRRAAATASLVVGELYAIPFYAPVSITAVLIGIQVQSAVAGAARLGIYDDDAVKPGALLLDADTVDVGTIGTKSIAISQALGPDKLYWLVVLSDTTASLAACDSMTAPPLLGTDFLLDRPRAMWQVTQAFGALPDPFPVAASIVTANPWKIGIQI